MKRVIKMSKAWIAAFVIGAVLTGCGGGSSGGSSSSSDSVKTGSQPSDNTVVSSVVGDEGDIDERQGQGEHVAGQDEG